MMHLAGRLDVPRLPGYTKFALGSGSKWHSGVASVAARSAVIAARKGVDAAQPSCALVVKRLPTSLLTKL